MIDAVSIAAQSGLALEASRVPEVRDSGLIVEAALAGRQLPDRRERRGSLEQAHAGGHRSEKAHDTRTILWLPHSSTLTRLGPKWFAQNLKQNLKHFEEDLCL